MTKRQSIETIEQLDSLEAIVTSGAERAAAKLLELLQTSSPLEVLRKAKFEPIGSDPLSARSLNLVEQINQTFTYLASFEAVRYLLQKHPEHAPYAVNLGTESGTDVFSSDGAVVAEVFAAVRPTNNRKLARDVEKVAAAGGTFQYVFFSCPSEPRGERPPARAFPDVKIVSLGVCGA